MVVLPNMGIGNPLEAVHFARDPRNRVESLAFPQGLLPRGQSVFSDILLPRKAEDRDHSSRSCYSWEERQRHNVC